MKSITIINIHIEFFFERMYCVFHDKSIENNEEQENKQLFQRSC